MIALAEFFKAYWTQMLLFVVGVSMGGFASHVYDTAQVAKVRIELADVNAKHSSEEAQSANAAIERLQLANQKANSLQTALDITEQRLAITQTEMNREIQRNTSGRACLNGRTVSLLNSAAASGTQPTTLPNTTSGAAETSTGFTTDTDIANWINNATTQYNTCRARLDALIDWHLSTTTTELKHD
ncbi:hypothetical protein [Undibacterium sp. TJN19]|uniref:hypothetical protein n=1 Tax=Undibacterium sp. TJN19 TaxID=3413055 RepID=UPI003BEF6C0A